MNFPLFNAKLAELTSVAPTPSEIRLTVLRCVSHFNEKSTHRAGALYALRVFKAMPEVREACANSVMANEEGLRNDLSFATKMQNMDAQSALWARQMTEWRS